MDSDVGVAACLFGLTLKPGDVEQEFLDGYTARQQAWLETGRADELYALVGDVEASAE